MARPLRASEKIRRGTLVRRLAAFHVVVYVRLIEDVNVVRLWLDDGVTIKLGSKELVEVARRSRLNRIHTVCGGELMAFHGLLLRRADVTQTSPHCPPHFCRRYYEERRG